MQTYDLSGGKLCDTLPAALRADILSGAIAPGEKLPSKRRLAEHHGISINTVQNAYEQLIAEGYIESRERSGYYVSDLPTSLSSSALPPVGEEVTEQAPPVWLDLVTNTPDGTRFPFSLWARLMRRVLTEEGEALLAPLPAAGAPALQSAIAEYLRHGRGIAVEPCQVVIGAGTEYLYHLLLQLLGRERVYGLEDPGHSKIARIYALNGVRFRPVPLDEGGVCADAPERLGIEVLHISPNHHFPTGIVTPATRRRALLAWMGQGDRYIIEDDYDSEFRFTGRPIPPLFGMDTADRVIYMNTFSKTIAPSMRISYMVLPKPLLARYRQQLGFYACPVPAFEQYTLARFLREGHFERHLHRMRTFYRTRRDAVIALLQSAPFAARIRIKEADAGLHFLVELKIDRSDGELRSVLEKGGIRVAFLGDYHIEKKEGKTDTHTIVLNYSGVEPERLAEGIRRLCETL
ncbi:MAG: PLP-dependent aminotransferase family protein [Ruminococcaceae bacterium]|nr:PLP-dependent aminotransferase family protein [Oscillospiraceae bacterium]